MMPRLCYILVPYRRCIAHQTALTAMILSLAGEVRSDEPLANTNCSCDLTLYLRSYLICLYCPAVLAQVLMSSSPQTAKIFIQFSDDLLCRHRITSNRPFLSSPSTTSSLWASLPSPFWWCPLHRQLRPFTTNGPFYPVMRPFYPRVSARSGSLRVVCAGSPARYQLRHHKFASIRRLVW